MMIDKQLLRKRFSEHAKTYDEYASVQKRMARQLLASLPLELTEQPIAILEIGCGSGYLTDLLYKSFPKAQIIAIDLAPGMIEVAQQRMKGKPITFICGDIEEMVLQGSYDIIISNATFQWLNYLSSAIERLSILLKPNGMLLFSTFGSNTFQELHISYQRTKERMQLPLDTSPGQSFFSLEELHHLCEKSLHSSGLFHIIGSEQLVFEYFPTVRTFFNSIKKIGANNSNKGPSCQRPSFFRELMKTYEAYYRDEHGVKATYHCIFFKINK